MKKPSGSTLRILEPVALPSTQKHMMGAADVPIEAVMHNLEAVLKDVMKVFSNVTNVVGNGHIAHVDITLGIGVDGSVGVFGSKIGGEAKGGIAIRLVPDKPPANK